MQHKSAINQVWLPRLLTLGLILYFWAIGIAGLDRFPAVHEDEPWIAAPGYTFWEKGYFGTNLFAGFYGMEHHYYSFPPVFSMLVGGGLHLFGMGLFQARVVPLICITLTLALTYRLGTVLFGIWHGLVALAVLVGWRIARPVSLLMSGIPMADVARIARYDAAVPLFGLAALLMLTLALRKPSYYRFFMSGILAGLAMLSHLYGGFWLAALLLPVLFWFGRRAILGIGSILLGFSLILAPWLLFIASGWSDFLNQIRNNAARFSLLDPQFYVMNLSSERQRYQPILDAAKQMWGARLWLGLLAVGLAWLVVQAVRGRHQSSQILLIVLASIVGLFAFFSPVKTFSYLATVWPLFALVVAAGWISLWRLTVRRNWKLLLIVIFGVVLVDGRVAVNQIGILAARTTPYQVYVDSIAALLPPNSRVMGLQHYWFGLAERTADYRTILVPIDWTNPAYVTNPISFGKAADAIPPDVLLIDAHILNLLKEIANPNSPLHELGVQINDYLREHDAKLIGSIDDATYGQCLIYQLSPAS